MLKQVVERGTGKLAQIEEFAVAGKTGTARKLVDGHYSTARHFSSFAGIAPADRPRVVALITVDEPQGAQYGGTVAAPAVGALLRETLLCLGLEPRPKSDVAGLPAGR
jgi:stage V sporulation protein D (sporulation-specific penicillin-binding protein)